MSGTRLRRWARWWLTPSYCRPEARHEMGPPIRVWLTARPTVFNVVPGRTYRLTSSVWAGGITTEEALRRAPDVARQWREAMSTRPPTTEETTDGR